MPRSTRRSGSNPDPQLKLFMTPKEIVNQYQVLDGDREDYMGESARAWEITGRPTTTGGRSNDRWLGTTGTPSYRRKERVETDEQVWARKSEEAQMDPDEYAEFRGDYQPNVFRASGVLDRSSAPKAPGWSAGSSRWDSWNAAQDEYLGRK